MQGFITVYFCLADKCIQTENLRNIMYRFSDINMKQNKVVNI
jgi:hypothetical protein